MSDVIPGPPYPGLHQHFRGDIYLVHGVVTDQTNRHYGRILVLYEKVNTGRLMVREVAEFLQKVHPEDGTPSFMVHLGDLNKTCNLCVPRFYQMSHDDVEWYNKMRSKTQE